MGWSSGSNLFKGIISSLKSQVPHHGQRVGVYSSLIPLFEQEDCDTLGECVGEDSAFDQAFEEHIE